MSKLKYLILLLLFITTAAYAVPKEIDWDDLIPWTAVFSPGEVKFNKSLVDKEIKIPDDSTAKISSSSLFGGKFLEIVPGSSETFLKNKSVIYDTQTSLSFTDMIGKMIMSSGK